MQNESKWEHELALLKHILDSMPLEKATKWGADVYTYKGKNVVSYGGFKHHFALWFFNGVFLKDPHKLLCATSDNTKALRKMEFNNKAQINEAAIREYIY